MLRLYSTFFTWWFLGLVFAMAEQPPPPPLPRLPTTTTTPTTPSEPSTAPTATTPMMFPLQSQQSVGFNPMDFLRSLGGGVQGIARSVLTDLVLSVTKTGQLAMGMKCEVVCGRVCQLPLIDMVCPLICSPKCLRSKRSITKHIKNNQHLLPMPNHFSAYDLNEDGVVCAKELAFVTGQELKDPSLIQAFILTDKNDDKVLTPKELYEGPFVFEMDISKDDELFCQYMMYRKVSRI